MTCRAVSRRATRAHAVVALLLLSVLCAPRLAAQEEAPADDEAELAELLALLEQETAVATHTRMNSDYVPGIVTVLEGEELEALGFETVWDALAMVPGMQPVRGGGSSPSTIVRGIQFPFNSGNIKILLDGVALARQNSGANASVLFLPIEQVDRIEVIRGPGSVVYGDFAFMGLVNILTRKQGARVYLRGDDDEQVAGGARAAWGEPGSPWQLAVNLAAMRDDEAEQPNLRRGEEERGAAVLSLGRGGFSLVGQAVHRDLDDTSPPGTPGGASNFEEDSWALEAGYERELAPELLGSFTAAWLEAEGNTGGSSFDDRAYRFASELNWDGWQGHSWLLGAEYVTQEIESARQVPPAPPPGQPQQPALVIDGVGRDVASVVLQDRFDLADSWSVTAGARFDDYSDLGSRVTPRLSVVWRASERHIWKAQYAEGFRAPTFFEEYRGGFNELDFEVNRTTELNYVYRRARSTGRVTLFRSRLVDMIFVAGPRFGNTREVESEGVEVEWTQQLGERFKLIANVATADTADNRGPTLVSRESPAAADWLADLAVLARLGQSSSLGLHWYHVAERAGLATDDGYDLVDLSFSGENLFGRGLGVRAGVKNALDDDVGYIQVPPNGIVTASVFRDRTAWLQLSWRR
jgi:outer membrane receptor for ferrienterochelin and colicins